MPTHVAIHGATGRVGSRLVALAHADPAFALAAALASPTSPRLGRDAAPGCGVPLTAALPGTPIDCVIDFSTPAGTRAIVRSCVERLIPVVVATTGHDEAEREAIHAASGHIPVLLSPNTSLVVNLLFRLTHTAATVLAGKGFDVEIIERHHRFKKDSPSGTASHFASIVQKAMGQTELRHGREGLLGERPPTEIGVHAVRAGDNVGEHTILFAAIGESLELVHKGTSRDSYAVGALAAAAFLKGKPAGVYTMADVLGL